MRPRSEAHARLHQLAAAAPPARILVTAARPLLAPGLAGAVGSGHVRLDGMRWRGGRWRLNCGAYAWTG